MKRTIFSVLAVLALIAPQRLQAQVSDVSVIVSPTAGYTFWNKQLNVGNSAFYGARVGFGFGPILELRGNYERSFDLKGKLQGTGWNVANEFAGKLENSKITYERIGGDLKLNLWNNARFTPYVIGGAYDLFPAGKKFPRPGKITVEFLDKIKVENLTYDEIVNKTYTVIKNKVES